MENFQNPNTTLKKCVNTELKTFKNQKLHEKKNVMI